MSRALAGLAAIPVLLISGALTAAFLLPADRLFLLGPIMIAGAMVITMIGLLTLLPRVIRRRIAEAFGEAAQGPGRAGFSHHHASQHHDHGGSGHCGHDHFWSGTSSWTGPGDIGGVDSSHGGSESSNGGSDSSPSSSSDSWSSSGSSDSSFSSSGW